MSNKLTLDSTPFTDKMLNKTSIRLTSFHALPINQLKSVENSQLLSKYTSLLGLSYANSEITYTGSVMDSPVIPNNVLKKSQELTAKAFGAKKTFYVTVGTSISNFVSVLSATKPNDRVLADRNCHQSMHFAMRLNKNNVDYSNNTLRCESSGRAVIDMEDFLKKYRNASECGYPYKLVILNSCSYEGIIYNLEPLIEQFLNINDKVTFLIDEAWFSYGYFHDYYKKYSAMNIAGRLAEKYPNYIINIISTQSAHKSLSTLRQGSYIHVYGDTKTIKNVCSYRYMIHTTSPSYPILASLELARAQMVLEGNDLIDNALNQSYRIAKEVSECKEIYINEIKEDNSFIVDPTKISVNFSKKNVSIDVINAYLIKKDLYINRKTADSILFNIHIGISRKDTDNLINILKEIDSKNFNVKDDFKSSKSDYYLISYPPGTPVLVPSDNINNSKNQKIKELKDSGASLIKIYK